MFTSLMRVLHEMLPCSRNFFSMKRKYRQRQIALEDENAADQRAQRIREIASPRVVRGLSLGKSPSRRQSSRGQSVGSHSAWDNSSRFSSMQQQMPDVRVKKNMSRQHVRNSSRQNKVNMSANQSNFLPELNDINSREDARSPMGSPKKLHMQNKIRNFNAPNDPRMDFSGLQSASLSEVESGQGSPITPSKTFGVRNFKRPNIEDPRRSNFTAKESDRVASRE